MKKVNSSMVARRAGVSQPTVSRVLNNSPKVDVRTRQLVLAAAGELGYPVLLRGRGLRVGVVMSQHTPIGSYQAMALSALKADICRRGWQMEIAFNEDLGVLSSRALSGAVTISGDCDLNRKWCEFTALPLVRFAARSSNSDNIYSVYTDVEPLMKEALALLRQNGHRRIGLLLRRTREQDEALYENLGAVFLRLMPGFGMGEPEKFISYARPGAALPERLDELLALGATALIVIPGDTALEVCSGLKKRGIRIPEQLSLITRDFAGVAEFWSPPLTAFRPDYEVLSIAALDLLEQLVRNRAPAADVAIPGKLILRESVSGVCGIRPESLRNVPGTGG